MDNNALLNSVRENTGAYKVDASGIASFDAESLLFRLQFKSPTTGRRLFVLVHANKELLTDSAVFVTDLVSRNALSVKDKKFAAEAKLQRQLKRRGMSLRMANG